jgi:hypothetical protein
VELFRDMLPSISRVAVLANPADPFTTTFLEQVRLAGRSAGIRIEPVAMAEDLRKQKPHSPQYPRKGRMLSLFREFSSPKLLLGWR